MTFFAALAVLCFLALWLVSRTYFNAHTLPPVSEIESERVFQSYALAYGSSRVALSFDDGPRPIYTNRIMDILEAEGVHATFFVIGQNVLEHPDIARSITERGFGIAAHSFTHSSEVHSSEERLLWELGATRFAIETTTGVSPRLYRPPYQLDITATVVNPRIAPAEPIEWALAAGYIPVGGDVDPYDWVIEDPDEILTQVELNLDNGSILVFHDTEHTAEALPRVLALLKNRGYDVVPLEDLIGLHGASTFPVQASVISAFLDQSSVMTFATAKGLAIALLFIAILLVLLRLSLVGCLLLLSYLQTQPARRPSRALVSVIIPAWNEEENIEATMRSVIASQAVKAEVVVVDDGSTDRTFEIASRIAQETTHVRVTVIRKQNGGKASALNMGLTRAHGTIIVCLDADTIFEPYTVSHLIRPLRDPAVGAVSGKVAIAGARSLLTRMQALEYLIGQNVQKRAFQMANALSVIPGAVGAWRKRDILLVGGVPSDTLVEDHDLTLAILSLGRRVVYEQRAVAYTEAPATIRAFLKQRIRWVQGAMQCAAKYRRALWSQETPPGLRLALLNAFAYDLFLPFFYPVVDLILIVSIVTGNFSSVALPLLIFLLIDFGIVALALRNERGFDGAFLTVLLMRLIYRHLLFVAFLISFVRFVEGVNRGWQKLKRNGEASRQYFGALGTAPVSLVDNAMPGHLPPPVTDVARSAPIR